MWDKRVYVAITEHLGIKIGVSANPPRRIRTFEHQGAGRCRLIYQSEPNVFAYEAEAVVKRQLAAHRIKGEYFDVSPNVAVEAASAAAEGQIEHQEEFRKMVGALFRSAEFRRMLDDELNDPDKTDH